jgi:hypothetical protein
MSEEDEYENPCAGWYYDEAGNVVCPYCDALDSPSAAE